MHYLSHITGHGLRKLMRAEPGPHLPARRLPAVPEVLGFVVERAGLSKAEAHATLNMGVGLRLFRRTGIRQPRRRARCGARLLRDGRADGLKTATRPLSLARSGSPTTARSSSLH